jgi:hypothetical protein
VGFDGKDDTGKMNVTKSGDENPVILATERGSMNR